MRTIIIIQAIIIVLGAYYLSIQSQEKKAVPELVVTPEIVAPTVREGYTPPTGNPPTSTTTVTSESTSSASGITGHSDVGMEYPIMDAKPEVR